MSVLQFTDTCIYVVTCTVLPSLINQTTHSAAQHGCIASPACRGRVWLLWHIFVPRRNIGTQDSSTLESNFIPHNLQDEIRFQKWTILCTIHLMYTYCADQQPKIMFKSQTTSISAELEIFFYVCQTGTDAPKNIESWLVDCTLEMANL